MGKLTGKIVSSLISALLVISSLPLLNTGTANAATTGITLSGTCHVQDYGDTVGQWDAATGILTLGTRGQSKRVEAITINLENSTGYTGTLQYRVHVQDIGWQDYRSAGEMAGTSGQSKRLEGIEMQLTGELAQYYTVEYAVHIQDYGDNQGFVSDGALAGTTGESKRLEEVQVRIVPRGQGTSTSVNYRVHRQDYGWESTWAKDGAESGTVGESKRLEGIEIHLTGNQYSGSIEYRTHVQNIGWESTWSKDGEMSGTQGLSYRLEGIEINLTGEIADYYDVYYRVHAQDYGWLGWAKNGEMSGTSGLSKRLEAIQIVLVAKGGATPGNVAGVKSVINDSSVTPANPQPAPATCNHNYVVVTTWVEFDSLNHYCCQGIDFGLNYDATCDFSSANGGGVYEMLVNTNPHNYVYYECTECGDNYIVEGYPDSQKRIISADIEIAVVFADSPTTVKKVVVHNIEGIYLEIENFDSSVFINALVAEYGYDKDKILGVSSYVGIYEYKVLTEYWSDGTVKNYT